MYSERSNKGEGHFYAEKNGKKWEVEDMRKWSEVCLTGTMTPVNYLKEAEENYEHLKQELKNKQRTIKNSKAMAEVEEELSKTEIVRGSAELLKGIEF